MVNWTGDGNGYVGNLDLEPEKANTVSATFDWHATDRAWEFKATPYFTHVTDYIDATPIAAPVTGQFASSEIREPDGAALWHRSFGPDAAGEDRLR